MQSANSFNRNSVYASLAFTLLFCMLTLPLLRQTVAPVWDALDLVYPSFCYLAESLRDGRLPLWDPFTNCGDPFHSDPNRLTLSPIAQLFALLFAKPSAGFTAYWLTHWWLGGIGMLWLARIFGAEAIGAVAAAFCYAFSGFFVGHAEHTTFIVIAAWFPWIIGLAELSVVRKRISYALLAGAAFGFCAIDGGYPGLIAMTGVALAFWLLIHHLVPSTTGRVDSQFTIIKWILLTLMVVGALLVMVWAPYLNAFFVEGAGFTDRVSSLDSNAAIYGNPFTPKALLSLLFPFSTILFSNVTNLFNGANWMGADLSMTNAYLGIIGIPLAWIWLRREGDGKKNLWLAIFAGVMFLISMGGYGGIRTVLFYLVPPTRFMQYNAAFRLFWILPLCLAAGLGVTQLTRDPGSRKVFLKALMLWLGLSAAVAAVVGWFPYSKGFPPADYLPRLLMPGIVVLPLALGVVWFWTRNRSPLMDRMFPLMLAGLVVCDLGEHLYVNSFTVWSRENAAIVQQLETNLNKRGLTSPGEPPSRSAERPTGNTNSQQLTKIPVVSGYMPYHAFNFNETLVKSRFIEVLTAPYRFWLSPGAEPVPSREQALAVLTQSGLSSPIPVFVEKRTQLPSSRVVPGSYGIARITSYAPEEVKLTAFVPGSAGAILASTERYAPGWKVWIDGRQEESLRINLYFRGVRVPPGEHSVVWRYQPARWVPLVVAGYATILLSVIVATLLLKRDNINARQRLKKSGPFQ
ncbi:hypothetical protein [Geoanaerobacter pelophilus]|nr:hypothetical protein [Geoanaerobacter pelophilus]